MPHIITRSYCSQLAPMHQFILGQSFDWVDIMEYGVSSELLKPPLVRSFFLPAGIKHRLLYPETTHCRMNITVPLFTEVVEDAARTWSAWRLVLCLDSMYFMFSIHRELLSIALGTSIYHFVLLVFPVQVQLRSVLG